MKRSLSIILMATIFLLASCSPAKQASGPSWPKYQSYKEIPGVTQGDIDALEALRSKKPVLSYGLTLSTEAFVEEDGALGGFAPLLYARLSELLGFEFTPTVCDWDGLIEKIGSKEVDFSSELTATPERLAKYFMTDAIIQRSIKVFSNKNNESLSVISKDRRVRCAFIRESTIYPLVKSSWNMPFEPVFIDSENEAVDLFLSGDIDAYIDESIMEALFDSYDFIKSEEYYPLNYSPVSLTTGNPELEPIIGVVQKYLRNGGFSELTELYNEGSKDYLTHKLYTFLSDEEKEYIDKHNSEDTAVLLACEADNYPSGFYNAKEQEFQGIAIDVLNQISELTGIRFRVGNKSDAAWPELLEGLENGKYSIATELIQTNQRVGRFLWSETPYCMDNYAMISRADYPDVDINQILFSRIGLLEDAAYTDVFREWFPDSTNTKMYLTNEKAFAALEKGEIDLLMATQNILLNLTNYQEKPGYKANIVFNYSSDSFFGFNKDEKTLNSIVNKALRYANTDEISARWNRKVFDYQSKMLKDMVPYAAAFAAALFATLIVVCVLFIKNMRINKNLGKLVEERTNELALQTSTLSTMFDSIPDIVFCKDINHRFTRCNRRFEEHFARDAKDVIGRDDEEALGLPSDVAEGYRAADQAVISGGRVIAVEEYIPASDGTVPLFETIKTPLMQDGKPIGIMGISRDITQRKAAEETLKLTLDNLDACVYISDTETGEILFINNKMAEEYGDADCVGKKCWGVLQQGCSEQCEFCPVPKLQQSGDRNYVWEELSTVTGKYYKKTDSLIRWHDGRIVHMQHSVDITDSIRMKRELEEAVLKLQMVVKNYDGVIWSVDKNRTVTLFDGLYLEKIGIVPSFLEGKPINLAKQKNRHLDIIDMVDKTFESGPQDIISEIGEDIYKSHTTPVKDKDGNIISVVGDTVEVTEMIRLQKELKATTEIAESASRAKGDFLSRMSHEIRTPLNAIIGMNGIAMNTADPDKVRDCLNKVDNASKHLLGIINDILDMSKIEADKFELSYDDFDFEKLLMNTTNVINFRVEEKRQNFVVNLGADIPPLLYGDELRLAQVITNLLSNAVKFTPEHGTVILNATKIADEADEIVLQIEVKDTGIGIDPEQQARLFTSFEQANGGISRKFGGTGLGLAISKRIVELMGGRIWIESEPGIGSTFAFTVRVKQRGDKKHAALSPRIDRENVRILAVDDSLDARLCFAHYMDAHGLPYDLAGSGAEAIEKVVHCGDKPYNVFFIDWLMPEMDGIELTKRIKEITADHSVVFMVSVADWNDIEKEALSAGVKRFIAKPLFPSSLIDAINECFGVGEKKETPAPRSMDAVPDFSEHTILIAEDVEINREIMSALLEETGVSIDFAENGQIAVSAFCENPDKYSLILMDIHMPEMDGYEATEAIRGLGTEAAARIPIVAMTANVFKEDIDRCLAAGMNDHTGKPVDAADLIWKMDKYMNGRG